MIKQLLLHCFHAEVQVFAYDVRNSSIFETGVFMDLVYVIFCNHLASGVVFGPS